jgi:acyl carrier protein
MSPNDDEKFTTQKEEQQQKIKVLKIIENYFFCDSVSYEISVNTNLHKDLGIDSLELLELVILIEAAFEIDISDDELDNISTVADIVNLVNKNTTEKEKPKIYQGLDSVRELFPHGLYHLLPLVCVGCDKTLGYQPDFKQQTQMACASCIGLARGEKVYEPHLPRN